MKRRAEQPARAEEGEPPFDALARVMDDLSSSRQALLVHSQALTECMRIVGQLHQILSNAHQGATERIEGLQANMQPLDAAGYALCSHAERCVQSHSPHHTTGVPRSN